MRYDLVFSVSLIVILAAFTLFDTLGATQEWWWQGKALSTYGILAVAGALFVTSRAYKRHGG